MSKCMGCMKEKGDSEACPYCGYMSPKENENAAYLPEGTILQNRYLLGRVLGQGGFGITYIGYDNTLDARVAIKEYYPGDIAQRTPGDKTVMPYTQASGDYEHGKKRFIEEARTLARFSDFPGIVSVKDCFEEDNTAYMVMQFLEGIDLKEYLKRKGGKVSPEEAVSILTPVMDALKEIHRAGIIHRDISPDNIFITTEGQIKLIDFGAARQSLGGGKSLSIQLKPGYAPEEQYRTHGNQGPWTDVYALAATLYRMVTGQVPPEAMERLSYDTLEIPRELPENIRTALQIGLAVRAPERYASVEQFQNALSGESPVTVSNRSFKNESNNKYEVERNNYSPPKKKSGMLQGALIGATAVVCVALIALAMSVILRTDDKSNGAALQPTSVPVSFDENSAEQRQTSTDIVTTQAPAKVPTAAPTVRPQPTPYNHAADEAVLARVVNDSTRAFTNSVNTGDFSYLAPYVDPNSSYYSEQSKAVASIHGRGVKEELMTCGIVSIDWLDDDSCNMTQHTIITCYYTDGTSKDVEETYTYLMKRSGDSFVYSKMYT